MNNNFFKTMLTAGVLTAFTFGFAACNSETKSTSESTEKAATSSEEHEGMDHSKMTQSASLEVPDYSSVDQEFKAQIDPVYQGYLNLKDGLVASSVEDTKKAAQAVAEATNKIDASRLSSEQKAFFDEHATMVRQHAQAIAGAGSVDDQRKELDMFSTSMFSLLKAFGVGSESVYYQYCPMANNEKGAHWVSQVKEIRNPYFGEKMLKCGETKETLSMK